ncbi:MAG: Crp/Fnr family transcriptional regulator [Pseudoflavonifractor sp.]
MTELSEPDLALLGGTFLFRGGGDAALNAARRDPRCTVRQVAKGQTIYTPTEFSHALGILLTGSIQVSKEGFVVSTLKPGDGFGAAALFNDRPNYATTLTARADCRLVFFPQPLVAELMREFPALTERYIRYLSGRIRFLEEKMDGLLAGSAERKLAQYLLAHRTGRAVALDCSATGLAARLGVSRASLYRALDALTAAGGIAREGKEIHILDLEKLQQTEGNDSL